MAIPLPDKFTQICIRFNANQPRQRLFTPSKVNLLGTDCWYQGNGVSLNFLASLNEITAANVPFLDPLWTSKERQDAVSAFKNNQKIGLLLYLQKESTTAMFEIGLIELFNSSPYFRETTSVLKEMAIQPGWELWGSVFDLGNGFLRGNDYISVTGFCRESGSFLQDSDNNVIPVIVKAI